MLLEKIIAGAEKNKRLYRRLDILSAIPVLLLCVVFPVWWHYDPENGKPIYGKQSLQSLALAADIVPFLCGGLWLMIRYATAVAPKHPFMQTQKFRNFIMFGVPVLVLVIIRIIGNLWN